MEGNKNSSKKLDMQRMLALRTISRADEKFSTKDKSMSISYLLKPSDSHILSENSDSMNPSDIFNISDITSNVIDSGHSSTSNTNLSQSVQEILAASCLKDVQDSVSELEDISKNCPANDIRNSWSNSVNFGSMRNSCSTTQSFEGAGFTSFNHDLQQRLLDDEKEWRQEFADIPHIDGIQNFSQFSGYLPSSIYNKMESDDPCNSFGEYFQGGCENLNDMMPNRTPQKSKPVPIVAMEKIDTSNLSLSEKQNNLLASNKGKAKSKDISFSYKDDTCIASISTISRALNAIKENDSPRTIISTMLKKASTKSKPIERDVDAYNGFLYENSIISGNIESKLLSKENTNPNIIRSASSSTLNSTADFIALTEKFPTGFDQIIPTINVTSSEMTNKLPAWVEPQNRNQTSPQVKEISINHSKKSYSDVKFEESVIIIQDDSNTSLQDLDITVKETNLASVSLWSPFFVPLKLNSKSATLQYINAHFFALKMGNKMITDTKDFIKIEFPTNSICLKPNEESLLFVKVWGFIEGTMNVTLLLEGSERKSQKKKNLQHSFNINFFKPSITISVAGQADDLFEFGSLPKSSSKIIDFIITNNSKTFLSLKLKLNCAKKDLFSIIYYGEDDGLTKAEQQLELQDTAVCGVKFMTGSESSREKLDYIAVLDIGLYTNDEFVILKSCNITGSEVFSHILFDNAAYPLRLEFGETRPAMLLNDGDIDLSYYIYIGYEMDTIKPCTDDMFTIMENRVTVKKNEQAFVYVTLNHELLSSAQRVLIFEQTLNGPLYYWPLIGMPRSAKRERSPMGKLSPSKVDDLKLSHKNSPASDLRTSCGSASDGSEIKYGDKLPIKSIKSKVSWPSVNVGKTMVQEVTIKNASEHRMKINIEIPNTTFSLANNKFSSFMSLHLHGCEVRAFQVAFCPRTTGLHVSNLEFTTDNSRAKVAIPLVGFGGVSDVSITGVFRLPNGTNVLSLGQYSTSKPLQKTITLTNKGSLPAFAHVLCDHLYSNFLLSEVIVTPDKLIIQPNTSRNIDIRIRPGKYNMSQIKQEVLELAKLCIVTGDEGLRQRVRQLYKTNPVQKNESILKKILPLFTNIDGEPYYVDLKYVKESITSVHDLLAPLVFKEIHVTVETNSNRNSDISAITIDESLMFHSLCIGHDTMSESVMQTWSFEPSKVVFLLPHKLKSAVKISSSHDCPQNFEVTPHPLFKIKPMSGMIPRKGSVEISLLYLGRPSTKKESTSIRVLAENDVLDIPIDINIVM